ncbi:ROK family protein [Spelaeicoccus albus]|uniref:Glucokinase n=1 Tax=Spelaeicoccus albus TaxID=1280376 RepID=A0A7Z0CYV8_9MICO|nr:ROK family protein [Spelaeicoccus albus]NYI65726.1 glucokinase [Spelaeicoccus albus]
MSAPGSFAVDVGGTDIKSALVDGNGDLHDVRRTPTPVIPGDGEATGRAIVDTVAGLVPAGVAAAGLIVPGWVDDARGVAVQSENLGWRNFDFRTRLEAELGIPVGFGHDVRAAGLAEYRLGAAREYSSVAVVPIGTGIAAALILDGQPYSGDGLAGEIGHLRVADGPACACGSRGCLEAVASAGAIARIYRRRTGDDVDGAREVIARMHAGDRTAAEIWRAALDALATAFTALTTLIAPEAIVIGGGLGAAGNDLFDPLADRIAASLTFQRPPVLVPAGFGQDAGLIGAGLLARDRANPGVES